MKKYSRIISSLIVTALLFSFNIINVSAGTFKLVGYTVSGWNWFLETETDGTKPDAAVYLDSTEKYSGDYSLKMVYNSCPLSSRQLRGEITARNIKPNATYRLGFQAKAKNAPQIRMAMEYIGEWMELTKKYGTSFDWKPFEIEFVQTLNQSTTKFVIASYDVCEAFWIDDLYLYEYVDGQYVGNNLISNPGFENGGTAEIISSGEKAEEVKESFLPVTASDAVIVNQAENIVVDGEFSEWNDYKSEDINTYVTLVSDTERTVESNIRYAYDADNLYFAVEVQDEEHNYEANADYWKGDCIQFVVDNNNANGYGEAIGAYIDTVKNEVVFISDNGSIRIDTSKENSLKGSGKRIDNTSLYEIKVPWEFLGMTCPDKVKFDLIVNDNDGGKRKGYLEIAPGIGAYKSNELYPYLYFGKADGLAKVALSKTEVSGNEDLEYTVEYINPTSEDIAIKITLKDMHKEVVVPALEKYSYKDYISTAKEIGTIYDKVIINRGESEEVFDIAYTVIPDEELSKEFAKTVKGWHNELVKLRDKCNSYGISTEYENVDIQILELYIDNIKSEAEHEQYYRIANYYEVLTRIYNECKAMLEGYLSGEKTPVSVPRYLTGKGELKNGKFYGNVIENGVIKEKPIIFYGYNAFESPEGRGEYFKNLGHNHMQTDMYPKVLYTYKSGEFTPRAEEDRYGLRSDDYEYAKVLERLDEAQKNNIAVDLGVHIMGFYNSEIITDYPDYKETGASYHHFMPFTPTHEMVRKQAEVAYAEIAKLIDRYECIHGLCLLNEPSLQLNDKKYYFEGWTEYLKKTYNNDIAKFNSINGSSYVSFSDVLMPADVELTPLYHDYRMYCEEVFTEFVSTLVSIIKENTDLPVSLKIMQQTRVYQGDNYTKKFNTTFEKFADIVDLNGCDAFYNYSDKNLSLQAKMEWYDYLTSVKNVPVANTEEHWLIDYFSTKKNDYSEQAVKSIEASGWQGMMHGAAIQDIWLFSGNDRSHGYSGMSSNEQNGYYATDVMMMPESMRLAGRLALDAMRLSEEIYAIQEAERNVGVLWSNTTWSYNTKFLNGLYKAYTNSIYNGQKVRFVTESTLEQMKECKVMIVPGATNVPYSAIEAIKSYVDNGGKLIIIGEDSLSRDEHNQPFDTSVMEYIKNKSLIIPCDLSTSTSIFESPDDLKEILEKEFKDAGIMNVVVKDKSTGETVKNVEWISTEHNGKTLISLFNYDYENEPEVEIFVNGNKLYELEDVKNLKEYENSVKLESYEPYLISVDSIGFNDIAGVPWAEEAINMLNAKNIISGIGNGKFAPNDYITREQLAKIVVSCLGKTQNEAETNFVDVDKKEWYATYVATAEKLGIANGITEKEFGVGQFVTRQDLVTMIYRAKAETGIAESTFNDSELIADYAKNAVGIFQAKAIVSGNEKNMFLPNDYCTRAEAAKIIYNSFYLN